MPIRIVLAEDTGFGGVQTHIDGQPDLEVAEICADLPSLLAVLDAGPPDVVVCDLGLPPTGTDEGIRAAAHARRHHPDVGVVMLSEDTDPGSVLAFLEAGSRGRAYLVRSQVSGNDLAQAIRVVAGGGSMIDPRVVGALVEARTLPLDSPLRRLTRRESEILRELAQGKDAAAVATSLFLSERAVDKHVQSIFAKLALSTESDQHRRIKALLLFLSVE